jgi:methylamine dehydrogenase accessory protein MauD
MTGWLLLNSIGLLIVGVVLFLALRQIGFILRRVTPLGARGTPEGPRIGESLKHHLPELWLGPERERATLLIFASDSCGVCKAVRQGAEELARHWKDRADIVLVYDCDPGTENTELARFSAGLYYKRDCEMRRRSGARFVPFGIRLDTQGVVIGKGTVNEIGHLESLLELESAMAGAPVSGAQAAGVAA